MNQNDMDRYFWRTGQKWSGDSRAREELRGPRLSASGRTMAFLLIAFVVTSVILFLR
jgi:hypothetical protein